MPQGELSNGLTEKWLDPPQGRKTSEPKVSAAGVGPAAEIGTTEVEAATAGVITAAVVVAAKAHVATT